MPTVLDFQRLRDTLLPEWTKPENASVFDPAYRAPVRTLIRALGLDDPQQVMALGTSLDAGPMAGGALEAIGKRFPKFAEALKLYHGSPHDFEKFDASKIGTGEGAQAYGHGLYFAENPAVANDYKETLTQGIPVTHKGEVYGPNTSKYRLLKQIDAQGKDAILDRIEARLKYDQGFMLPHEIIQAKEDLRFVKDIDPISIGIPKGKMYEVAVHADPEHFLDWDKPLSQQSQRVKEAIAKIDPRPNRWNDITGRQFVDELTNSLSGAHSATMKAQERASRALNDAGVTGIRYFDQASRSGAEGTRNYVVFPGNEHLIEILNKYGIAATTGVGIAGGLNANE